MRNLVLIAFVATAVLMPRAARACGQGNNYLGTLLPFAIAAAAVAAIDGGLTVYDAGMALTGKHASAGYGVLETVVFVPQVALGVAGLAGSSGGERTFFAAYTIWMAVMAGHGIWTAVAATPTVDPPAPLEQSLQPPDKPFLRLGPTYVPLGPEALPAFGLSGRF